MIWYVGNLTKKQLHTEEKDDKRSRSDEGHGAETLVHLLIWPEHIKHLNYIDFGLASHTNTPGHASFCITNIIFLSYKS